MTFVNYFVQDQFDPPATIQVAGIDATELLLALQEPPGFTHDPSYGVPKTVQSDGNGSVLDRLFVTTPTGVPPNFYALVDQQLTVSGFTFGEHQIQEYFGTFGQVTFGQVWNSIVKIVP